MLQFWGPVAVVLDFLVWLVVHIGVSLFVSRMPRSSFNPQSWLYRERGWENRGKIYENLFRIKAWKGRLPDGAAVSKKGFRKKRLLSSDNEYLHQFILESCRAELTHWLIFAFAIVFFIWNDWRIASIMVLYGIIANFPCIITQRFNRFRLIRVHRLSRSI